MRDRRLGPRGEARAAVARRESGNSTFIWGEHPTLWGGVSPRRFLRERPRRARIPNRIGEYGHDSITRLAIPLVRRPAVHRARRRCHRHLLQRRAGISLRAILG